MLMFEEKYFALSPNLKLWVHIYDASIYNSSIFLRSYNTFDNKSKEASFAQCSKLYRHTSEAVLHLHESLTTRFSK